MGVFNTIVNWCKILRISHSDKDHLAELQQKRLRRILHHAVKNSEYYQDLYRGIDVENCALRDLPIVTKSAMMKNYDRLVTDRRLKLDEIQSWVSNPDNVSKYYLGKFSPFPTSGSTGESGMVTYHRKEVDIILASMFFNVPFQFKRPIFDHVKTMGGQILGQKPRIAVLAIPRGNLEPIFKRIPAMHRLFVNLKVFSLLDPVDQIVDQLNEFQPDQLGSPTFFIALLAQEQLAGRLNLTFNHPLSFISGEGEVLTEHTRNLALKAWNMSVQDTYGAMECYIMATSCGKGHLHVMNDLCIIEIVDRNNQAVPHGQYGEKILLTNLFNFTQPIIRYEIEDVTGYANQHCECGSPFPTLLPVQGRATDFFYFKKPEGGYEQFHPYFITLPLFYFYDLRQYQITQTARNEITLNYVLQNKAVDTEQKLKQTLKEALAQKGLDHHVRLHLKQVDSISRHERSGKYKYSISLGMPSDPDLA